MLVVLNTCADRQSKSRRPAFRCPHQLIAAGTPGLFSPRGSFSLDVLGGTIIMFGGLTRNAALEPFPGCGVANSDCVTFNEVRGSGSRTPPLTGGPIRRSRDRRIRIRTPQASMACRWRLTVSPVTLRSRPPQVWQWSPGTPTAPLSPAQCATPSCGWAQVEIVGVSPPARYSHASGVLADKLFMSVACARPLATGRPGIRVARAGCISPRARAPAGRSTPRLPWRPRSYGGLDANGGILADMWAFSRTDKSWALVTLSGAPLPTQSGAPAGAFLGSVFYLSLATPAGAALYRVKPCFDCAPAATGGGSPTNVGLIAGLVAGGGVLAAAAAFVYVRRPQWAGFGARGAADASAGHYFTSLS